MEKISSGKNPASTSKSITVQNQGAHAKSLPAVPVLQQKPVQLKENNTGMPDNLKTGIENISGYSMNDTKVHYNSDKPAQLNALAYAQGSDIHVGPGQEKHLPHEAWHVVQQKQGRVQPTLQMKQGIAINDDTGLEAEADQMGAKALQTENSQPGSIIQNKADVNPSAGNSIVQRVVSIDGDEIDDDFIKAMVAESFPLPVRSRKSDIQFILREWIKLKDEKEFGTIKEAINTAAKALGDYAGFAEKKGKGKGKAEVLVNEATTAAYAAAHISKTQSALLFDMMGEENFTSIAASGLVTQLKVIYDKFKIGAVATLTEDIETFRILAILNDYENLIKTLGVGTIKFLIDESLDPEALDTLFNNMGVQHVKELSLPVVTALLMLPEAGIAAIESGWNSLEAWLDTTQNLTLLQTIVAGGYTYPECATLAFLKGTPAEVRAFQQRPFNYALLSAFAREAVKYNLTWANMVTIANANPGANIGALCTAIKGRSLALIDKETQFSNWIDSVSKLMIDDGYTLTVGGVVDLNNDGNTMERKLNIFDNSPVKVNKGNFVVHYHPGAEQASQDSPYSSPKHIKPVRGNKDTQRVFWGVIPGNIKALI